MKRFLFSVFTIIAVVACKGQIPQPDTLVYYSQGDVDSIISYYDSVIANNQNNTDNLLLVCQQNLSDTIIKYRSLLEIAEQTLTDTVIHYQNLMDIYNDAQFNQTVIADTFQLDLYGKNDNIHTKVTKKDENIWVSIVNDTFRINTWYLNYETQIYIMDTSNVEGVATHTIGSMLINSDGSQGSLYLKKQ